MSRLLSKILISFILALAAQMFVETASAAESQSDKMLAGLVQRHYYDTAVEYLEKNRESSRFSPAEKQLIDYKIAVVHFGAIISGKSPLDSELHIAESKKFLRKFLEEHSNCVQADNPTENQHENQTGNQTGNQTQNRDEQLAADSKIKYVFDANLLLGKLLIEEAGRFSSKAGSQNLNPTQNESLLQLARNRTAEALTIFQVAEKIVYDTAKKLQSDPTVKNSAEKLALRDTAYANLVETRYLIALAIAQHARCFDTSTKEFRSGLLDATTRFHDITVKYKDFNISIYAKLQEATAWRDLGNLAETRALLKELVVLPASTPSFTAIIDATLEMILELNLREPTEENLGDSVTRIESWLKVTPQLQQKNVENGRINLLAAKTYLLIAKSQSGAKRQQPKLADKMRQSAIWHLKNIPVSSPCCKEAENLLTSLAR